MALFGASCSVGQASGMLPAPKVDEPPATKPEQGALAMTALLTHRLNGILDDFWAGRPLQRAA